MLISYIIPMLNGEKTIKDCLLSIFNQDHDKEFEVIIVDNGSDDHSLQILSEFSDKIQILHLAEKNRSKTRNLGASKAKGELLAFIDCDVILNKDWSRFLLNEFSKRDIKGAQGPIIPFAEQEKETFLDVYRSTEFSFNLDGRKGLLQINNHIGSPMIDSAACIYDRKTFLSLGGFDEHLIRHEDVDLSKRTNIVGHNLSFVQNAIARDIWVNKNCTSWLKRSYSAGKHRRCYNDKWKAYHSDKKYYFYSVIYHIIHFSHGLFKHGLIFSLFKSANIFAYFFGVYLSKNTYNGEPLKYNSKKRGVVYNGSEIIEFDKFRHIS